MDEFVSKLKVGAAKVLEGEGIDVRVINIHTIKPLDVEAVVKAAKETGLSLPQRSIISSADLALRLQRYLWKTAPCLWLAWESRTSSANRARLLLSWRNTVLQQKTSPTR